MIFTQEQINEIRERLLISGKKDTQFSPVSLPMSGEEILAITQDGESKKVPIGTFYDEFSRYIDKSERVDLLNVSRYAQQATQVDNIVPLTLEEAIAICPNDVKRPGQILTFLDQQSNTWAEWQYKGTTKDGWNDTINWVQNTAGIVSVNSEGVAIDNAGRKWQLTRYIETYVTPSSDWTYDGTTKPLATTNPEYTIYWANSVEALVESTDTTIPTAKNAGTHTYYWKVDGMGGYPGTTGNISVVVSKKAVTFTSQGATKTYDGNNVTASIEVTITGALQSEPLTATAIGSAGPNAGSYKNTISYSSDYNTNYNVTKSEGDLVISKVSRTLTWTTSPASISPIDAGTAITATQCVATRNPNAGTNTVKYYVGSTQISFPYTPPSGTITITAKVDEEINYTGATISAQVVVNEKTKRYALSSKDDAPVPSTDNDVENNNFSSKYNPTDGSNSDFPTITSGYYAIEYAAKMAWFAIPKNRTITRIFSVAANDDWLNINSGTGLGFFEITETTSYKVYYVKSGSRGARMGSLQVYVS